jgi:hypothetical protein
MVGFLDPDEVIQYSYGPGRGIYCHDGLLPL